MAVPVHLPARRKLVGVGKVGGVVCTGEGIVVVWTGVGAALWQEESNRENPNVKTKATFTKELSRLIS